jgi:cytochrome c-type biogenesis protein CcmH
MIKKKLIILILIFLFQNLLNVSYAVDPNEIMEDKADELRARVISKNIRCMVCQNQSIDESSAPLAKDLRILIREEIKNGKSNDEIYDFLRKRYGDFILLKPLLTTNTLALWFLPFIFLLIGFLIFYFITKKYKKI